MRIRGGSVFLVVLTSGLLNNAAAQMSRYDQLANIPFEENLSLAKILCVPSIRANTLIGA